MSRTQQPSSGTGAWMPSPWFLAQVNHVLAAFSVVLFGALREWRVGWVLLGIVVVVAFKEFVADLTFLEHDTFRGSLTDFFFYLVGAWLGCLTVVHPWLGLVLIALVLIGLTLFDIWVEEGTATPYD